jgi:exonuclease V
LTSKPNSIPASTRGHPWRIQRHSTPYLNGPTPLAATMMRRCMGSRALLRQAKGFRSSGLLPRPQLCPGVPLLSCLGSRLLSHSTRKSPIQIRLVSQALNDLDALKAPSNEDPPPVDSEGSEQEDGNRSPLQRFRTYPRKPLSVSDLTSGAWCELQYWYVLTRLPGGRRTRTQAMRQGSKVHKKLEDEVHETVRVEVSTKEDAFGLRLWNFVQGLRTLRDTGLTRELEVWGMVEGNLVNGIIDSVSHQNPNPSFEEELLVQGSQQDSHQATITDYFPTQGTENGAQDESPKIYLADVKTRANARPVSAALLRPSKIQLLLYHQFLSDMAAGRLDLLKVIRRYGLDAEDPFTDVFIAQIGSLHDEIFADATSTSEPPSQESGAGQKPDDESDWTSSVTGPDLLKYRTLQELVSLVKEEIALTFPKGEDSMGNMLRVQYVLRKDGSELDSHDFPASRQVLKAYLESYMSWWKGQRKATGVDIEEAFKCQLCEFASTCGWRQGMDEARLRQAQHRLRETRQTAA